MKFLAFIPFLIIWFLLGILMAKALIQLNIISKEYNKVDPNQTIWIFLLWPLGLVLLFPHLGDYLYKFLKGSDNE